MIKTYKQTLKNSSLIFEWGYGYVPAYVLAVPEIDESNRDLALESTMYLFNEFRTPNMEYKTYKVILLNKDRFKSIPLIRLSGRAKKLYNRHHLKLLTYNLIKAYEN